MDSSTLLLYFDDEQDSASRLAAAAKFPMAAIERHRFPDGELKLRLPEQLPSKVVLLRTLDKPNEKLLELLLVARTLRTMGVADVTLVAPYLAYMRQDIAFRAGEVVSQRVIGAFLADLFDAVITVDPHLHRVATLGEAVPAKRPVVLSGAPLLADWIAGQRPQALLIGPDEESAQWVGQAAARHGFDYAVCRKVRHGDRQVEIELPVVNVQGRPVVLLDDMASSGHTLVAATQLLIAAGARSVDVAVTHALFADNAIEIIKNAGVGAIWSTDCVLHPTNAVTMASAIAGALIT